MTINLKNPELLPTKIEDKNLSLIDYTLLWG